MVCGAFFTLGLVAYFYVTGIMKNQVDDLYSGAEMEVHRSHMRSLFTAYESAVRYAASSVGFEAARGAGTGDIVRLMRELTEVFSGQPEMEGAFVSIYGFINGSYLDANSSIPGSYFSPASAPWLRGALETDGIFHVRPYLDAVNGANVAAVSMIVRGVGGEPIGVVAIDYYLTSLIERVRNFRMPGSGWGFLLDGSFSFLTCPDPAYLDRKLSEYPGFGKLGTELMEAAGRARAARGHVSRAAGGPAEAASPAVGGGSAAARNGGAPEMKRFSAGESFPAGDPAVPARADGVLVGTVTLDGTENVVFFSTLENGWHIGIVAPMRYYYAAVFRMLPVITLLGAVLAFLVCLILVRMGQDKKRSEDESLAKTSFLARMSHEIRTPMNAVMGMCELARRSLGKPEAADYIAGIGRAGADLLSIINDILDFSKISVGGTALETRPYRTSELLGDAVSLIRVRMEGGPVELRVEADPLMPAGLEGDAVRVRQVLNNLLSNAFKYTRRGSVTLRASCAPESGGRVRLALGVEDTGIGIRREELGMLFEEFVRLERGGVRHIEGTGLGLAISRSLCRLMGGDIRVESEFGSGSVFTAEVLQGVSDPSPMGTLADTAVPLGDPEGRTGAARSGPRFSAPGFRVLVVDDIETNLIVAKGLLEPYGMEVEVSLRPARALELCAERGFDLLFIDHMMPEMDGVEVLDRVRAMGGPWEKVPAVVLTAAVMAGNREMFLSKGFDGFLGKPVSVEALDGLLERFVPPSRRAPAPPAAPSPDCAGGASGVSIDGLDSARGIQRMGGRREGYVRALAVFLRDLEERRARVGQVDASSLADFRIQVHAIKSAAANVGASALSEEAALLEDASARGDAGAAAARLPRFRARLTAVSAAVRGFLDREAAARREPEAAPPAMQKPVQPASAASPAGGGIAGAAGAASAGEVSAGSRGGSPALPGESGEGDAPTGSGEAGDGGGGGGSAGDAAGPDGSAGAGPGAVSGPGGTGAVSGSGGSDAASGHGGPGAVSGRGGPGAVSGRGVAEGSRVPDGIARGDVASDGGGAGLSAGAGAVAQAGAVAPEDAGSGGADGGPRLNVDREMLLDLKSALERRDIRAIDGLLEAMGAAAGDRGTRDAVERISTSVLMADYEEAEHLVTRDIPPGEGKEGDVG
ncbi:MAG: response regulator [Deltaproteobacteria bacterium]|jgi:signal transduction histidine kinase/HPt (histidine-containing phosphotransfer) domain-containing protein|nr:response regulator [Deltaproteobacteria bacterium]